MTITNLHTITPYGRRGGSSRVRVFDWLDHLGLHAEIHDYLGLATNRASTLKHYPCDIAKAELALRTLLHELPKSTLLMSKQASPFSRGGLEEALLTRAGHSVYDFDDSLLDEVPSGTIQKAFRKDRIWRRSVASADVVIAGNDYLADQASDIVTDGRIVVIPSCVEPSTYATKKSFEIQGSPQAVWLGSPSTESSLSLIEGPLLQAHQELGLRLTVISAGNGDLGALSPMVDRIQWTPEVNQHLAQYDFGIMPLRDSPQSRGKCAYKLLQYGASALPAIASPVGANKSVIENGAGIPAESPEDWTHALQILSEGGQENMIRGQSAKECIELRYSFQAWESVMTRAIST